MNSIKTNHTITTKRSVHRVATGIGRRAFTPGNFGPRLVLALALLAVAALPALASDPMGIYAYVDRVVLEPSAGAPERIQVWGGFALAEGRGDRYTTAQRGCMYFKLRPGKETLCQNEWADLKSVAGTGKIVGFGQRYASNGVVRLPDAKMENPDVYPIGMGVQKISKKDYKPIKELDALRSGDAGKKAQ